MFLKTEKQYFSLLSEGRSREGRYRSSRSLHASCRHTTRSRRLGKNRMRSSYRGRRGFVQTVGCVSEHLRKAGEQHFTFDLRSHRHQKGHCVPVIWRYVTLNHYICKKKTVIKHIFKNTVE